MAWGSLGCPTAERWMSFGVHPVQSYLRRKAPRSQNLAKGDPGPKVPSG